MVIVLIFKPAIQWTDMTSFLKLACVTISPLLDDRIPILLQWAINASLAISSMIDFVIALAMCYYLWKSKGDQSR